MVLPLTVNHHIIVALLVLSVANHTTSAQTTPIDRTPKTIQFCWGVRHPQSSSPVWDINYKQISLSHSESRPRWSFPKWLGLPSRASLVDLRDSDFGASFLAGLQAGIVVFLAIEIFRAFRDVRRELMDEASGLLDLGSFGGTGASPVLSQAGVENLLRWISACPEDQRRLPRSVPPYMANLAHDLKKYCHSLSDRDIFGILSRISKQEAQMLQSCMLRPTRVHKFDRLQGLDHVTGDISRFLRQNGLLKDSRKTRVLSPYSSILQEGRQGMALWGPPGCGKSTLIKAIADEAGLPTLIITPSLLQRKYYGESTNQVRVLFGLVSTLGPCILVLDELDGLFRSRNNDDHEAGREMKTEFLQWWDGVVSDSNRDRGVLIVGATNRPFDVDPAVWRRLPERFYIGAADWNGRHKICNEWVESNQIPTRDKERLLKYFADNTQGYTNSDLRHVFQTACQVGPMSRHHGDPANLELTAEDIGKALNTVSATRFTPQYMNQLRGFLSAQDLRRSQPESIPPISSDDSQVWQSPVGNFYQIESHAFDALTDVWTNTQEKEESSDGEDLSVIEENDDIDFD
jgi:ATPase family AAA domain-containing protein 1